jgi:hypothetical protein
MEYEQDRKPAMETGSRKGQGEMDEETMHSTVRGILESAHNYVETELSPRRAKATAYYQGKPFGNEEAGRSQVVLTEVRDGVLGVLPSLLRVFFSAERALEFIPKGPQAIEKAEQATDYIQRLFMVDNSGFLQSYSVLKDGLVRELGIFKWGWEESDKVDTFRMEGLTSEQLELLTQEPGVTITKAEPNEDGTYNVDLTRSMPDGRPWVRSIAPEEFWFTPEARSLEDALCVAHVTEKTRGELIALGISEELIEEHGQASSRLKDNDEEIERRKDEAVFDDPEGGEANEKILYAEAYPYLDVNGDGTAELIKVCTIGDSFFPVKHEPVSERPFSIFTPDPEPHTLVGQSWADRLMDLQLTKSSVLRASLDSLALSIFPRTAVVEGEANMNDVLNTEIGAPIRQRAPGMVTPFEHTFVGKEAFPVLAYLDEVRESRTGQSKGAIGLDADALQSSTKGAVGAAVQAAQAQTEMLARVFAEMTLKPLFRGLLRLLHEKKPRAQMVKLRGKWVEVDPATWDSDMDVEVNVALGTALVETKLMAIESILQKQEAAMQLLGPDNDLVSLVEYRKTLDTAVRLLGYPDSTMFFKPVTEEQLAQRRQQAAQQPPQPSPEMLLAQAQIQVEQMKAQTELMIKEQELKLRRLEIMLEDDRQRDKQAAELAAKQRELELKEAEIEAKFATQIQDSILADQVERHRITTQTAADVLKNEQNNAAAAEQAEMQAQYEAQQAAQEPTE